MDAPATLVDDAARHAPLRLPAELTIYTAAECARLAGLAGRHAAQAAAAEPLCPVDASGRATRSTPPALQLLVALAHSAGPPAAPAAAAATQRAGARRLPRPGRRLAAGRWGRRRRNHRHTEQPA
jgi:hypothetical protein